MSRGSEMCIRDRGGGAWPFLVGGVICLVNSVNERDLSLLKRFQNFVFEDAF